MSGLFDPQFYASEYPDAGRDGSEPLDHYLRHGAFQGHNPSPEFDATAYLQANPDVAAAKVNPLLHYIDYGRFEGRQIEPPGPTAPAPAAPQWSCWEELAARVAARPASSSMDVIVPVYRGHDETANCLYTVVSAQLKSSTSCEIVVIDDDSPEENLSDLLARLAAIGLFTLLRNDQNIGFVASANRGMKLHSGRDVILLNSDTEVYGDWVDRLYRTAYSEARIGTVTPFSNNATICSYPYFNQDFSKALEIPFEQVDQLASDANRGMIVDLPTGVGFCMYIRRACLEEIGLFDDERFGHGYGEENDFCLRAAARGWRNVLAADTFVRHIGRVSFQVSTEPRIQGALRAIARSHPRYSRDVVEYVRNDPPLQLRRRLDIARLRQASGSRTVLFVSHNLEGGTRRHIFELSALLEAEGIDALWLRPSSEDDNFAVLSHPKAKHIPSLQRIDLRHGLEDTAQLLSELHVEHIHIHHLMGFAPEALEFFESLSSIAGIPYDFTIHDYLPVCPRINMIDASGIYCGSPDLRTCELCVATNGSPFGNVSVERWRASYERLLRQARKVFAPNEDVIERLQAFMPSIEITPRPHPEAVPESFHAPLLHKPGETLRVALIGALGPHKGSLQILRCAQDAQKRRLPIKFVLFGFSDIPELTALSTMEVTGRYAEKDLKRLIASHHCHLAFFPAVWPETYSYTLSQAWFAGLYPVAFDIGAIARRIREAGWGLRLPLDFVSQPGKTNDALLACTVPPMPEKPFVTGEARYANIISDYYELELQQSADSFDVDGGEVRDFANNSAAADIRPRSQIGNPIQV